MSHGQVPTPPALPGDPGRPPGGAEPKAAEPEAAGWLRTLARAWTTDPLPRPPCSSPPRARTGRRPRSPRPYIAPMVRAAAGRSRGVSAQAGKSRPTGGRGPAGSRLLLRLPRAPACPRPVPPAPHSARPQRGRGRRAGGPAPRAGGARGAGVRVCARPRPASRWAGLRRVRARRSAFKVRTGAAPRVCVREGARCG